MRYTAAVLAVLALASVALGQAGQVVGMTFSVDFQGPTAGFVPGPFTGIPDPWSGLVGIDEGCILTPAIPGPPGPNAPLPGPLPPPGIMVTAVGSPMGSVPGGLGIMPGVFGGVEVDALSYGRDRLGEEWYFSVDEFAMGIPGSPLPPNVFTEGAVGAREASADVFVSPIGPGPLPPLPPGINFAFTDGDGIPPSGMPGVGLIEPNPPTRMILPDPGDNLDAVDIDTTLPDVKGRIYFSLDSYFRDPLEPFPPANTGTALGNGFVGGDVLVTTPGGIPVLYAAAPMLGLDIFGPDTDDLDALVLEEDGDGVFTMRDKIFFSVRRGSAIIGMPDSRFGIPIEEGDILTVPTAAGGPPSIWIAAESLGLWTVRSFGPGQFGFGDDLDALDVVPEPASLSLLALGGLALIRRRRR